MRKLICLLGLTLLLASPAFAQILWMGGEDVDFPNGQPVAVDSSGAFNRSSYSREALQSYPVCNGGFKIFTSPAVSTAFPAGAVTDAWLHFVLGFLTGFGSTSMTWIGVGTVGTLNSLAVGIDASAAGKLALWSGNGAGSSELASEAGTSISSSLQAYDLHIVSYGAAATVTLYVNENPAPVLTFTGDVTAGGATSFNSVFLGGANGCGTNGGFSEIIVSTADTRAMSLVTLVPGGAGGTNTWTSGAYTNINPAVINDASVINSQTSAQDFQATMNALPVGNFAIRGIKVVARSVTGASGITSISPGVFTHSTIDVPVATALNAFWFPIETYYAQNPVTSLDWTLSDINTLQLDLRSAP